MGFRIQQGQLCELHAKLCRIESDDINTDFSIWMSRIATLSDLLAAKPLVDRSPFAEPNAGLAVNTPLSSTKEKEYQVKLQHLTELLNESEANHQRLLDQEKVNDRKSICNTFRAG